MRLSCLLQQMKGLAAGYAAAKPASQMALSEWDLFFLNFAYEAANVFNYALPKADPLYARFPNLDPNAIFSDPDHCSALIRVTDNDLYFAHDAWYTPSTMLRQFKVYAFDSVVAMVSYPGMIFSFDDWYMTSKGMAVTETTNGIPNTAIYMDYVQHGQQTVSEFLRTMIATYLSETSPQWHATFEKYNSGTYNNQWMTVDMKLFKPGQPIPNDTLWVSEQIPGLIVKEDKSRVLRERGYWMSYNIATFPEVRDKCGANAAAGSYYTVDRNPRAQIFQRDAPKIRDLDGMKHIMRYNDYKQDEFSLIPNCTGAPNNTCTPKYSAMLSIASRGDLNPPNNESHYGPMEAIIGQRPHMAIDSKITSWSMMKGDFLAGVVINGPTSQGVPAFVWSQSPFMSLPHHGLPDRFDFPWTRYSTSVKPGETDATDDKKDEDQSNTLLIVIIVVVAITFAVGAWVWYSRRRNAAGEEPEYSKL